MPQHDNTNTSQVNITPAMLRLYYSKIAILPKDWANTIVYPGTKKTTHWLAIHLLSQLVYWYKPIEHYDEEGRSLGLRTKFKADKLHLSYAAISEQLGCSYDEARGAVEALVSSNTAKKQLRNGPKYSNAQYIEPNLDLILDRLLGKEMPRKLSTKPVDKSLKLAPPSGPQTQTPLVHEPDPSGPQTQTYTVITDTDIKNTVTVDAVIKKTWKGSRTTEDLERRKNALGANEAYVLPKIMKLKGMSLANALACLERASVGLIEDVLEDARKDNRLNPGGYFYSEVMRRCRT